MDDGSRDRSRLGAEQRGEALAAMQTRRFDVVVVGGGVTGCGVALDAATRGLSVALVEKRDFAAGTSSRSGKLIHGGLRYMEQLRFGLVRESLRERALLLQRLAPHLVKPLPFLYLLHHRGWERPYIGAGLALYDTLGGAGAVPRHRHLSRRRTMAQLPGVRTDGLAGAISFFDAQCDDARHTMAVARTAAAYGAQVATRVEVEGFVRQGGRVAGVEARDALTGERLEIAARHVVAATGVWSEALQTSTGAAPPFRVRPSKGVHLLVRREAIDAEAGFVLRAERDPLIFVRPWHDGRFWMFGTTDTPWDGDLDEPAVTREDVDYLLRNVNAMLRAPLRRDDVVGAFAGLRPLVDADPAATSKASREHAIGAPLPGLTTVAGGKYTTYRVMAEETVDAVARDLPRSVPATCTADVPLVGAEGYVALRRRRDELAADSGLSPGQVDRLLDRHGARVVDVLGIVRREPELAAPLGETDYLAAELVHAATHEGALDLDDALVRRAPLAIETADRGAGVAEQAAALLAPALGWDASAAREAAARYRRRAAAHVAAQEGAAPAAEPLPAGTGS